MLRILHNANYDFIRHWRKTVVLIVAFLIPGSIWLAISGFNYSIEFTGGTLLQLEFAQAPDVGRIRDALGNAGVGSVEIQTFGRPNEIVIRAQDEALVSQQAAGAEAIVKTVTSALDGAFAEGAYKVVRTDAVGPKVGGELKANALTALLISFLVSLLYLAWRFEWRFGVAALVATIHDILATIVFMRYANIEVSLFVVGAILTVIGYSLNDTIIVFDRVRENLKLSGRTASLVEILNRSVNETLPRTILTSATTLATLLALFFLGGEVIRPFAIVLIFGIVVGTLSSIFIASPTLYWIEQRYPRTAAGSAKVPPTPAAGSRANARRHA